MTLSRLSAAALPVAAGVLSIAALSLLGARARLSPPLASFAVFALVMLAGGGISFILGALSVLRRAGAADSSRSAPLLGAAIGLSCIVAVVALAAGSRGAPPIHDIATDTEDPPVFAAAARNPANLDRDLRYPEGAADSAAQQRAAYPDVVPVRLEVDADEGFDRALETAEQLGWRVVSRDADSGTFEAEAESAVFRFVDDVVVRVRAAGGGAEVDVRSTSRVGVGDMGVNAARIRRFSSALQAARR